MNIAMIFVLLLIVCSAIYALVLSGFIRGLLALRNNQTHAPDEWPSVSVIVPARNEAAVLERTLLSLFEQNYPGDWEIVAVDDRSTDHTSQILKALAELNPRLRFFRVTTPNPPSPKKNALALGIRESHGDIIVTTDADCVYDSKWLQSMIRHMTPDIGVVAGLTAFDLPVERVPLWQKIQWLDFLAQQYLAAGAAGAGVPSSCNGSNLAYRRCVYEQISGFGKSAGIVSGDDVLFAQRVAKQTVWKVVYNTDAESIVHSLPVLTIRDVFNQRIRWASKGLAYRRSMSVFLFGLYAYYLLWWCAPAVAWMNPAWALPLAVTTAWKFGWDYYTLRVGSHAFHHETPLKYFVPFSMLHVLLSPVFGITGLFVPYRWKGEWYRTATLPRGVKRGLVRVRRIVRHRRAVEPVI
ncbi:glycosyltransferase [candidate division KSB1 bacterium]|nr:MAG: glycosyltransferase [candidate division KSB1 bacterium]